MEGVHENVSFEARRFNIFLFSAISPNIKLTSELQFEHGTGEIKPEAALIDIEFVEALNLRGGILLLFAERQQGFYGQVLYKLLNDPLPMFSTSLLSLGTHYDYTGLDSDIRGGDVHCLTVGVNLRLVHDSVIKLDYQQNWSFDRINNRIRNAVIQFGMATYF